MLKVGEKKDAMLQVCEVEATSCGQSSKGKVTTSCVHAKKGKEITSCDLKIQKNEVVVKPVTSRYRQPIPFPHRLVDVDNLKAKGKFNALLKKLHLAFELSTSTSLCAMLRLVSG